MIKIRQMLKTGLKRTHVIVKETKMNFIHSFAFPWPCFSNNLIKRKDPIFL